MAEEDDAQKTEEPTPRKLSRAKEKGQTASSAEIKTWGILVVATIALALMAPTIAKGMRGVTYVFIEQPHAISFEFEKIRGTLADLSLELFWILSPLLGALMIIAIFVSVAQSGLIWAPSKVAPELSKISIIKGFGRMFSLKSVVEFTKGILKLAAVAVVAFGITIPLLEDVLLIPSIDFILTFERILELVIYLSVGTIIVMTIIAVFDYVYQKYTFMKQMRMTKQEVRDEHKQSEGDPQVKSRIRQIRTERARQRMMAEVPEADVVVTNPTHYAVALSYKMEEMQAPRLVAKGLDHLALKIREVAEEHKVPVVENPPLARALYASVELDEEIPMEHYQAVAEVIGYVMRLRGDTVH